MKEECNHQCAECTDECESREKPFDFSAKPNEMSHVQKVIGVISGKGGVGKSMVTSLLAVSLQRKGLQVGILDADITGPSIPKMMGIKGRAGQSDFGILPQKSLTGVSVISVNLLLEKETDPVVWRGPLIGNMVSQFWSEVVWDDLDVMLIDMPPGTGDVALTVFQSLPVDGVVIVTSPQELVSLIVSKSVKMAEMMNIKVVGIVENMAYFQCPECGKKYSPFGESHCDEIAKKFNIPLVAKLPLNPELAKLSDHGRIEFAESSELTELVHHIIQLEERK